MRNTTPLKFSARINSLFLIFTHAAFGLVSVPAFAADGNNDPRLTDPRVFDKHFYCNNHNDLVKAHLCDGDKQKAAEHWISVGIREGRQAHPVFSTTTYLDRYSDVKKAVDGSRPGAIHHYLKYGISEGRSGNPTPKKNWSNPASWDSKTVPRANADVVVQEDQNLILDQDIEVDNLTINGQVTCADKDINIKARSIMVHGGILKCGGASHPHTKKLEITLAGGSSSDNVMGMGTNVLGVMGGGTLLLHGEERSHSWLMLGQTADADDKVITLNAKTNWKAGDTILITPTRPFKGPFAPKDKNDKKWRADKPWLEAETRTIVSIIDAHTSQKLVLDKGLEHRHFGEKQTFKNGVSGDKRYEWVVDTRAEVALLSRNIKIQGDPGLSNMNESNSPQRLGAHVMSMDDGYSYIDGVEFTNVGQEGITGRYPFHWHLAGDVSGQYIKNSSIHRSFHRCVTVHSTNNALVENNVCYDHLGHGYFLEDGNETGNIFKSNLAALGKKPREGKAILKTDRFHGQASKGPASFWISNGDNTFVGNVGAGTEGTAFWYHTEKTVTGQSKDKSNINPMKSPFGKFKDNRAHSSNMALTTCLNESGVEGYMPPDSKPAFFENFTVFSAGIGAVWPCAGGNQTFHRLQVLDSGGDQGIQGALTAAGEAFVRYSLFVANSKLDGGEPQARVAMGLYDFGVDFLWTHFENYTGESVVARTTQPSIRRTDNTWDQVTLANSDRVLAHGTNTSERWGGVIQVTNENFSINGRTLGAGAFVPDIPLMKTKACQTVDKRVFCKNQCYALLRFHALKKKDGKYPDIQHGRSDIDPNDYKVSTTGVRIHNSVIAVSPDSPIFHYTYEFPKGLKPDLFDNKNFRFDLSYANPGDIALFQIRGIKPSGSAESVRVRTEGVGDFKKANTAEELRAMGTQLASTRTGGGYYYDAARDSLLIMVRVAGKKGENERGSPFNGETFNGRILF